MYIRRKVFSILEDAYGEERIFSVSQTELDERAFAGTIEYEDRLNAMMNGGLTRKEAMAILKRGVKKEVEGIGREKNVLEQMLEGKSAKEQKQVLRELTRQAKEGPYSKKIKEVNVDKPSVSSQAIKAKMKAGEATSHVGDFLSKHKKAVGISAAALAAAGAAGVGLHAYKKKKREEEDNKKNNQ